MSAIKDNWTYILDRAEAMGQDYAPSEGPLSASPLSGEYEGGPTAKSLCADLGLDYADLPDWAVDEVCEAFEQGYFG